MPDLGSDIDKRYEYPYQYQYEYDFHNQNLGLKPSVRSMFRASFTTNK